MSFWSIIDSKPSTAFHSRVRHIAPFFIPWVRRLESGQRRTESVSGVCFFFSWALFRATVMHVLWQHMGKSAWNWRSSPSPSANKSGILSFILSENFRPYKGWTLKYIFTLFFTSCRLNSAVQCCCFNCRETGRDCCHAEINNSRCDCKCFESIHSPRCETWWPPICFEGGMMEPGASPPSAWEVCECEKCVWRKPNGRLRIPPLDFSQEKKGRKKRKVSPFHGFCFQHLLSFTTDLSFILLASLPSS